VNLPSILLGTSSFTASGWNGSFTPRHESVRLPRVLRRTISHRRGGLDLPGVSDCPHRSELECSNARWLGVLGQSSKNSAISASRLAERRLSRERRAVGEGDGADPQSSIGLRVLGLGLVAQLLTRGRNTGTIAQNHRLIPGPLLPRVGTCAYLIAFNVEPTS
jgi:hypothetical protein